MLNKPKKKTKRGVKARKLKRPAVEVRAGQRETRGFKSAALSVRKAADGSMQLVGTAIVFDSPSQDLGGFTEVVKYESVQKSLQRNNDVFMLWQHDDSQPLSRTKTGSLKLTLTSTGLDFVATLPNSPLGQNAYQAICDGTVDSVSFGFAVEPEGDKWMSNPQGIVRELWDINVSEISPVTWAAYLAPHVDVRSAPADIRAKLKVDDPEDEDDPEDDEDDEETAAMNDNGCSCECDQCVSDNCDCCEDEDCTDEDCEDCPAQTRSAHIALLTRRLR
jgi:HK97 family phage prohead protease